MNCRERKCIYQKTVKLDQESMDIINSVPGLNFGQRLRYILQDYDRMKKCLDLKTKNAIKLLKISQEV